MICTPFSHSLPNSDRLCQRKLQIRTGEMETHRNRSLCSHDLIRHGGAGLSGSSAACCTDGKSKSNLWDDRESARIMLLSMKIHWFGREEERRCLHNLLLELNIKSLLSVSPPQASVMCPPLHCLNMGFLCSKYGHLRHKAHIKGAGKPLGS